MGAIKIPEAFFIKGNNPTENAILSVLEAQVRGELTSEKSTMFMRGTCSSAQIGEIAGVGIAVFRATVRVLWGSTWDVKNGTKRQIGDVYTTKLEINKYLTIDFEIPEFDIERFMKSPKDIAVQIVSNWTASFMRNLGENLELIFLNGIQDYAIAKSLVLPLDLINMNAEQAKEAYYKIWARNNKLIKLVNYITVGTNREDLMGATGIDSNLGLSKAFTVLNYSQISADTLAYGRRYTSLIAGMEFWESFYLEQEFIHDTEKAMHLEKDYSLKNTHGFVVNRYMWGMPISFTKIRQKLDNDTDNIKIIGKCLFALPSAIRPNLMYLIRPTMPTVAEIKEARAKDFLTNPKNENATYQSTLYDDINKLNLEDVIYYRNLGKITMAGTTPTNDELETAIINAGNVGYEKGKKVEFSNITSKKATISGAKDSPDYYGIVNLEFTKK